MIYIVISTTRDDDTLWLLDISVPFMYVVITYLVTYSSFVVVVYLKVHWLIIYLWYMLQSLAAGSLADSVLV